VVVQVKKLSDPKKYVPASKSNFTGKWMVQLGSFGAKKNAINLADKVRKRGFKAHTLAFKNNDKRLTKVLAGPFDKKRDADKAKRSLDMLLKSKSIVVKY